MSGGHPNRLCSRRGESLRCYHLQHVTVSRYYSHEVQHAETLMVSMWECTSTSGSISPWNIQKLFSLSLLWGSPSPYSQGNVSAIAEVMDMLQQNRNTHPIRTLPNRRTLCIPEKKSLCPQENKRSQWCVLSNFSNFSQIISRLRNNHKQKAESSNFFFNQQSTSYWSSQHFLHNPHQLFLSSRRLQATEVTKLLLLLRVNAFKL